MKRTRWESGRGFLKAEAEGEGVRYTVKECILTRDEMSPECTARGHTGLRQRHQSSIRIGKSRALSDPVRCLNSLSGLWASVPPTVR